MSAPRDAEPGPTARGLAPFMVEAEGVGSRIEWAPTRHDAIHRLADAGFRVLRARSASLLDLAWYRSHGQEDA